MKSVLSGLSLILLVGCVQTPVPLSDQDADWYALGKQTALDGQRGLSDRQIRELAEQKSSNSVLISAYQEGYQVGKQQYCQQSARMLGVMNKPYAGICDDIDPFFRQDYITGRLGPASGM